MRLTTLLSSSFALASILIVPRSALAFGGSARELERQGNFVITNNVDFSFGHDIGHGDQTRFTLRPALDYFVVSNLSLGGAIELRFASGVGGPDFSQFSIAPDIGYEVALSDTWSIWPSLQIPIAFPNRQPAVVSLVFFVPFLVHPAEHFFFGIGPGLTQVLAPANPPFPTTQITGGFSIGGYFDH